MSKEWPATIKLHDGTTIDTNTGKRIQTPDINDVFRDEVAPKKKTWTSFKGGKRRYLDNLPCPAPKSKAVAIIAAYHTFGLNPADIAFIMNTDAENVKAVLESEEFFVFMEGMLQNLREHDASVLRKKLNAAGEAAMNRITDLVSSNDEKVGLAASKDVLDRIDRQSGVDAQGEKKGTLSIRIIKQEDAKVNVELDLEV